jgi:hypothetical protein
MTNSAVRDCIICGLQHVRAPQSTARRASAPADVAAMAAENRRLRSQLSELRTRYSAANTSSQPEQQQQQTAATPSLLQAYRLAIAKLRAQAAAAREKARLEAVAAAEVRIYCLC